MIVEQRTYTFATGQVPVFLRLYEAQAIPLQRQILGNMLGYFTSEFGTQNQTVHLWGYDSLDDRQRRRDALVAHPDWRAFLVQVMPMILSQEVKILRPTAFSPLGAA